MRSRPQWRWLIVESAAQAGSGLLRTKTKKKKGKAEFTQQEVREILRRQREWEEREKRVKVRRVVREANALDA